jgi:hypothetical protein
MLRTTGKQRKRRNESKGDHEDRKKNGDNAAINKSTYLKIESSLGSILIERILMKEGDDVPLKKR